MTLLFAKRIVNFSCSSVAPGEAASVHLVCGRYVPAASARRRGFAVGDQMGVNACAAFAGADEAAFVDGDFAMLKSELQPVLKALRKAGINIVAIHNRMTHEEPAVQLFALLGQGVSGNLWPRD